MNLNKILRDFYQKTSQVYNQVRDHVWNQALSQIYDHYDHYDHLVNQVLDQVYSQVNSEIKEVIKNESKQNY